MEKKRAKTVRMDAADWEAVKSIKEYYGISSDTDAIRFALRTVLRDIKRQGVPSTLASQTAEGRIPPHA